MKKLIPAYILSFVFSFMLFIFEPISMYANNIDDFWFDIYILLKPSLLAFITSFLLFSIAFSLLYVLFEKILKLKSIYNFVIIISFVLFICTYIQGNFLSYNLPKLDGSKIEWNKYMVDSIISIILLLGTTIVAICLSLGIRIKIKKEKEIKIINIKITNKSEGYLKVVSFGSLAILVMLFAALVTVLIKEDVLEKKYLDATATLTNYHNASSDKNFYIFLLDTIDAKTFSEVINKEENYKTVFNDFTFYKDTLSMYGFTRDSIPQIITGEINDNTKNFSDYSNDAYDNSKFLLELQKKGYDINIYEEKIKWHGKKAENVKNFTRLDRKITSNNIFIDEEMKYIKFRYLPFFLKSKSKIETMNFTKLRKTTKYKKYSVGNMENYNLIKENDLNIISNKNFSFYHLDGAHVPYDIDENLNSTENGTYKQKIKASIFIANAFLNRLRWSKVYDNSVIIIMSDHGFYGTDNNEGTQRGNPMLLIKGINEHHDIEESKLPISYNDLQGAYMDLLNGKKSTELFSNVKSSRTRKYLWYLYSEENHMIEYETKGKAWNASEAYTTGKEYNR